MSPRSASSIVRWRLRVFGPGTILAGSPRMRAGALAGLIALLAFGCTTDVPPPNGGSRARRASSGEGAPSAGDVGSNESADGLYDPQQDPLVNPPASFEPMPEDISLVNTDQVLYRTMDGNPSSLNPLFMSSTYEFYMSDLVFEGLFGFDADMQWMVNDTVVEEFRESPDHLTYTIRLRPGLKWHDGEPLTAHDVVFSWQSILDERVPCPAVRSGTDQIVECRAVDDRTVVMVHAQSLATSKWNALFPIIPKHIYEVDKAMNPDLKSGEHNNKYNRAPIGNGPYRFVRWVENDKIELERWEEFPGPKPAFKKVIFRIMEEDNIKLLSFNAGDVDEFRLSSKQFAKQALPGTDFEQRGIKIMKPQWVYSYIGWNMDGSNPFFGDVRVRRAMAHALDLDRVISELTFNLQERCYGVFHPDSWMFNKEIEPILFDLDRAGQLLDEAGWRVDESRKGWRYKEIEGQPTQFEFTLLIPSGSSLGKQLAAIFQEDLRSIGVSLKTQVIEWATFQQRTRKHEFQASTAAWGTGTDPDTLRNIWLSTEYKKDGSSGRNYGGYASARVDELFDLARAEFDQEKRAAYYRELSKIIYDEQPYLFLTTRSTLWALSKEVRGVSSSPRGIFNFSPADRAWWVPSTRYAGMQR